MSSIFSRIQGAIEVALSVFGAALLTLQAVSGADGVGQIGAALVALIAPVCAAIRATKGQRAGEIAEAVSEAVTEAVAGQTK